MAVALTFFVSALPAQARTLAAPAPISDVYSEADMRLYLATLPAIESPCSGEECELNAAFDARVQRLGARVAAAAYNLHLDLSHRIRQFEFKIAEKKDTGVTSNASGTIVVLRGTQAIGLDDDALTFVLAREMGHVISQHHEENTTTRILLSVAAGILFPALNLFGNSAAVAQATSATTTTASSATLATTAASTATSWLGAKLLLNSMKPEQLSEADQVALKLMESMGLSHRDLALALENSAEFHPTNTWSEDFRNSMLQVRSLETAAEAGEPLPEIEMQDHGHEEDAPDDTPLALRDSEGNPLPPLQEPEALAETTLTEATVVDIVTISPPQSPPALVDTSDKGAATAPLLLAKPQQRIQKLKGKKASMVTARQPEKDVAKKAAKATKGAKADKLKTPRSAKAKPAANGKKSAGRKPARKKP